MNPIDHFATSGTGKPEIRREPGTGRPYVKQPGSGKEITYRRVTTFIDVLEDRYLIEAWKQRMVVLGMAARHDLVMEAASLAHDPEGNKQKLNTVADTAREFAGDTQASRIGTAVHALTEQIDRGEHPQIPPAAQADIDAYIALKKKERLTVRESEVFVVLDDLRVGGTFDRIYELDGVLYVGDIKTGSLFGGAKMERQLACYATGQRYDIATGERTNLNVDQKRGLIIWIPAGQGRAEIRWANLEKGMYGVGLCDLIWQERGQAAAALLATPPGTFDLFQAIADAEPNSPAMSALWTAHQADWTPEATQAAMARIAAAQAAPHAPHLASVK
jgi:hypothetical protein